MRALAEQVRHLAIRAHALADKRSRSPRKRLIGSREADGATRRAAYGALPTGTVPRGPRRAYRLPPASAWLGDLDLDVGDGTLSETEQLRVVNRHRRP